MKKSISIALLGLLFVTSNSFASDDSYTQLDEELPNGLTVAQTLAEWDKSSNRYRSEPPVAPKSKKSHKQSNTATEANNEKS